MKLTKYILLLVASVASVFAQSYQRVGNMTYGNNGTTYQQVGNTTYGNNGKTYQQVGNMIYTH